MIKSFEYFHHFYLILMLEDRFSAKSILSISKYALAKLFIIVEF